MSRELFDYFRIKGENYIITTSKKEVCCDDCILNGLDCAHLLDDFLGEDRKPCNNSSEGVQYQFVKVADKVKKIKCMSELDGKVSKCGNFFIQSKTYPLTVRFNNSFGIKRVVLTISRDEKSNKLADLKVFGFDKYAWAEDSLLITTKSKLKCYEKGTKYDVQRYCDREYLRVWVGKNLFDTIVLGKEEFVLKKEGIIDSLLDK